MDAKTIRPAINAEGYSPACTLCRGGWAHSITDHDRSIARAADEERRAAPSFYRMPDGWGWADVAESRERWNVPPHLFPVARAGNVAGWGVPIEGESTDEA